MTAPRIAIGIDMEWPYKHHHDAVTGIMRYAGEHTNWRCELAPYLEYHDTLDTSQRFDGVIARASKELGDLARRTGLPAVNIWFNSPDTSRSTAAACQACTATWPRAI